MEFLEEKTSNSPTGYECKLILPEVIRNVQNEFKYRLESYYLIIWPSI